MALVIRHLVVVLGRGGSKLLTLLGTELEGASCRFRVLGCGRALLSSSRTLAKLVEHVLPPRKLSDLLREQAVLVRERIEPLDSTMLELALELDINVTEMTRGMLSHRLGRIVVCGPEAQDHADVVG